MYRWIKDGNVAVMKVGKVVYIDVARWVLEDEEEDGDIPSKPSLIGVHSSDCFLIASSEATIALATSGE